MRVWDASTGQQARGFAGHGGSVPVYFEAAAVITTLVLMGQGLELRARHATNGAATEIIAAITAAPITLSSAPAGCPVQGSTMWAPRS